MSRLFQRVRRGFKQYLLDYIGLDEGERVVRLAAATMGHGSSWMPGAASGLLVLPTKRLIFRGRLNPSVLRPWDLTGRRITVEVPISDVRSIERSVTSSKALRVFMRDGEPQVFYVGDRDLWMWELCEATGITHDKWH